MEEARKVIRFVLPGVTFFVLLLIGYSIADWDGLFNGLKDNIDTGSALGSIVIAGGLGYIFSIIYFGIVWYKHEGDSFYFDHLGLLKELHLKNKIVINGIGGAPVDIGKLTKLDAWHIVNVYWHTNKGGSEKLKGLDTKVDTYYSDLTHGLGITIVASVSSFICFLALILNRGFCNEIPGVNLVIAMFVYVMFIIFNTRNYKRTRKSYEALVNNAFTHDVLDKVFANKAAIEIVYYTDPMI